MMSIWTGLLHRLRQSPRRRARFEDSDPVLLLRRTLFLAVTLCSLSACGFTPLYGAKGAGGISAAEAGLDSIYIANIPEREGQYLRNALIDRFYLSGRPENPAFTLSVAPIQESRTELDITKSSDATRAQLRVNTTMTLTDNATGKTVLRRDLTSITSYNVLQSHFTTRVSEENTRLNALDDLARQIELQLALYFKREAPGL